ncbi:hypothetical protein BGX26_007572 [Mortierella sp. AD094]|nr:hypothetical protein BGX26_007572 [Mortierella sp. AD094]
MTNQFKHPTEVPFKRSSLVLAPELLQLILSHLSHHNLRVYVSLVCHQWYAVAKTLILTEPVTWLETIPPHQILPRLENTRTLVIQNPHKIEDGRLEPCLQGQVQGWIEMMERLRELSAEKRIIINNVEILRPLRVDSWLIPLIAYTAPSLTNLKLQNMNHRDVPFGRIIQLCPRLSVLHLHYNGVGYIDSMSRRDSDSKYEPIELPSRLRLQSLKLESIAIGKAILMRLLASAPDLEELHLIRLQKARTFNNSGLEIDPAMIDDVPLSRVAILDSIASLCQKLKSAHFSSWERMGYQNPDYDMGHKLKIFPKVTSWSLPWCNLTADTFQALRNFSYNTLTTLEIINHIDGMKLLFQRRLHEFLCDSPNLLHLKAPKTEFSTLWFDLEGILNNKGRYYDEADSTFLEETRANSQTWNVDWTLKHMSSSLRIKMRLWSAEYSITDRGTIPARRPFALEVKGDMSGADKYDGSTDTSFKEGNITSDLTPDYLIDGVDMRNVGRLKDIVDLFQERMSQDWQCWPSMEYFELKSVKELRPKKIELFKDAFRVCRPDIEVK